MTGFALQTPMAEQAGEAMDTEEVTVIADAGYYKCEELLSCYAAGITANVPRPDTSGNRTKKENGLLMHRYWSSNCQGCELKSHCTPAKERCIRRWEFEELLEPWRTDSSAIRS